MTKTENLIDILAGLPDEGQPRRTPIEAILDDLDREISYLDIGTSLYREVVAAGRSLTAANIESLSTLLECAFVLQRISHGISLREGSLRAHGQCHRCGDLIREITGLIYSATGGSI